MKIVDRQKMYSGTTYDLIFLILLLSKEADNYYICRRTVLTEEDVYRAWFDWHPENDSLPIRIVQI